MNQILQDKGIDIFKVIRANNDEESDLKNNAPVFA